MELVNKLFSKLDDTLITPKGQHSNVYYELKNAGYKLRVIEQDVYGSLSASIKCPNEDWEVNYSYGVIY